MEIIVYELKEEDMDNSEKLEEKISEGLDELDTNDEKYIEKVKAVKDLYELKLEEKKEADDYYCKSQDVDNKTAELDVPWYKKINPNTVITTVAMGIGTLITLKFEKDGYLFKPGDFVRGLINRNK